MTSSAPAGGPQQTGRYKRSFKNYLIDSRFQLKYTGMIVLAAVLISVFLVVFLWKTSGEVVSESQKVARQSKQVAEQGKAVIAQTKQAIDANKKVSEVVRSGIAKDYADNPELLKTFNEASEKTDKEFADQQEAIVKQEQSVIDQANALVPQQEAVAKQQATMIYVIIGSLTIMVVFIGLLGIYFTHKVAGPIFKMKRLLRQVGEGKLVFHGKLRKGDELQDFFETFATMVESLRARQQNEVLELERAIEMARKSGASAESIQKVSLVRDEMKRALETG